MQGIVRSDAVQDKFHVAQDDSQHVVEVVGHASSQPTDRLHLLGLAQLLFQFLMRCFLAGLFLDGKQNRGRLRGRAFKEFPVVLGVSPRLVGDDKLADQVSWCTMGVARAFSSATCPLGNPEVLVGSASASATDPTALPRRLGGKRCSSRPPGIDPRRRASWRGRPGRRPHRCTRNSRTGCPGPSAGHREHRQRPRPSRMSGKHWRSGG